jgi:hypothetical protein
MAIRDTLGVGLGIPSSIWHAHFNSLNIEIASGLS